MSGFTDHVARGVLNHITGKSALFSMPTAYVGLFTAVGTDAGTGFTEVSGGSYARVTTGASDWNAASGTGPSSISNAATLTFPTTSAPWGTIIAFGLFDDPSAGDLLAWDYVGNFAWRPATISLASPGVLTIPAHGYSVADQVIFSTEYGGAAPSFSQSNLTGILVVAHAATDTFDVTNGGTQVNTSSTGSGLVRKVATQTIGSGVLPSFGAGSFVIVAG